MASIRGSMAVRDTGRCLAIACASVVPTVALVTCRPCNQLCAAVQKLPEAIPSALPITGERRPGDTPPSSRTAGDGAEYGEIAARTPGRAKGSSSGDSDGGSSLRREDDAGREKMSRRDLTNTLLFAAGAGRFILKIPLKPGKIVLKGVAEASKTAAAGAAAAASAAASAALPAEAQASLDVEDAVLGVTPRERARDGSSVLHLPPIGSKTKRILFARHGQTDLNKLKVCQGRRLDPPLNVAGRAQARLLLFDAPLEAVVCSPLTRARQTAAIVQQSNPSPDVIILDDLNEVDFGGAEGLPQPVAATVLAPAYAAWKLGRLDVVAGKSGESAAAVQRRAHAASRALLDLCHEGNQILAVSHSVMIKFTLATLLGVSLSTMRKMGQDNCAVNALDYDDASGVFRAVAINGKLASGRAEDLVRMA